MNCLRIWSCAPAAETPELPKISGYEISSQGLVPVGPEDIPAELYLTLPGICSCLTVNAEPQPGPEALLSLEKFARRAATALEGAYEFLNIQLPDSQPVICVEKNDIYRRCPDKMQLCLWFAPENGTPENRLLMLEAFEKIMPFALPEIFGDSNPPDRKYSLCEKAGFTDFLREAEKPVWFCRRPLGQLIIRDRTGSVPGRCGYLSLELPAFLDGIPEWHEALKRLLAELSVIYSAFFSQLICGECGVVSWWWRGIPYELGNVCIIGKDYVNKISDCSMGTVLKNGSVLFEDPFGPTIDKDLLSKKKFRLFARGTLSPENYTRAKNVPEECYRK